MKRIGLRATASAVATVLALALAAGPTTADDNERYRYGMGPGMMGQGYGPGYGMGPGMMGQNYGPGYGMGPGMMMGPGYGMGYGMGGYGPCPGQQALAEERELDVADVTKMLEFRLQHWGNPRLKVGKVEKKGDDTIVAEIVTKDGSLVDKFAIDRKTGRQKRVE